MSTPLVPRGSALLEVPTLHRVLDIEVLLGEPLDLGRTKAGHRRVVPVVGGRLTGAVGAEVLPGGSDWQVLRADGATEIDARYCARTTDGELVQVGVRGVRVPREGATDGAYFCASVEFETSSQALADLQRHLYVATGEREGAVVRHVVHRIAWPERAMTGHTTTGAAHA